MRMRLFLLVVLHALVISFLLITHPHAEEDACDIYNYDDYIAVTIPKSFFHDKILL